MAQVSFQLAGHGLSRCQQAYSAWLADTAWKEFTIRAGLAAVSQFEQDHGAFTTDEIADAEAWAARAFDLSGQSRASTGRRTA